MPNKQLFDFRINSLAASESHVVVSDSKGCLFTWGTGMVGELGIEECTSYSPHFVKKLSHLQIKSVAACQYLTVFKTSSGQLYYLGEIGSHSKQMSISSKPP
jgi:alpha-tubulin suppressor-like RCC1 family protein